MSVTTASSLPDQTRSHPVSSYPPSWIDRLLAWLDGLSVPVPVVLIGLWAVLALAMHAAVWLEGIIPAWHIDQRLLLVSSWVPYCLGLIYYLQNTADAALPAFRPALDMTDDAFEALRYQFTVLPRRGVLVSNAIGVLMTYVSLRMFPESAQPFMDTSRAEVVNLGIAMAGMALTWSTIYLTFRQLRLIRRTYGQATNLDLFRANQLYAFSALTLRLGLGWLIINYAGALVYPALLRNLVWAGIGGVVFLGIVVAFVTTLFDIHARIRDVKAQHMEEIDQRLHSAFNDLHQRIDAGDTAKVEALRETMEALLVERGMVVKLPTWPWQPGTLVSFLTAVLLPLLVWAIQATLQRLLGL
jgi:hypothetical protein